MEVILTAFKMPYFKGSGMGRRLTHLVLKNTRFCVLYVKINHYEAHLMVTSIVIDSKGLRVAI